MSKQLSERERLARNQTARLFGFAEDVFYAIVALALTVGGAILFASVVYTFVQRATSGPLAGSVLEFLDGLLLVFIITELIHTVRAVIAEGVLITEPFLIVGIVAAIRRLIVISAEAKEMLGTPRFADAMIEMGVLTGAVIFLGVTIFLLRRTPGPEPKPDHGKR